MFVLSVVILRLLWSEPWWAPHSQNEAQLPGSVPVLQGSSGIVGEKADRSRQNDEPTRQGGNIPRTLPRYEMCVKINNWSIDVCVVDLSTCACLCVQEFQRAGAARSGCFCPISAGCRTDRPNASKSLTPPTRTCSSSSPLSSTPFWWI